MALCPQALHPPFHHRQVRHEELQVEPLQASGEERTETEVSGEASAGHGPLFDETAPSECEPTVPTDVGYGASGEQEPGGGEQADEEQRPEGGALVRSALGAALKRAGTTLVLVEHRVDEALPLVSRVIVLEAGGGLVGDGPSDRIFASTSSRRAA